MTENIIDAMQTSTVKPMLHSAAPRRARFVVLAGVMVSSLFQAGASYAKLVADPTDELADLLKDATGKA